MWGINQPRPLSLITGRSCPGLNAYPWDINRLAESVHCMAAKKRGLNPVILSKLSRMEQAGKEIKSADDYFTPPYAPVWRQRQVRVQS